MKAEQLERLATRVENRIANLQQKIQTKRNRAQELESEASSIKTDMARAASLATRSAANDAGRRDAERALYLANRRYQARMDKKRDRAQEVKSEADQLQRNLSEYENMASELRKQAGFIRDYEIKAQSWADQAKQLLARG